MGGKMYIPVMFNELCYLIKCTTLVCISSWLHTPTFNESRPWFFGLPDCDILHRLLWLVYSRFWLLSRHGRPTNYPAPFVEFLSL